MAAVCKLFKAGKPPSPGSRERSMRSLLHPGCLSVVRQQMGYD